ncbi:unnamed protein product, partial [Cladocopium goreaui]
DRRNDSREPRRRNDSRERRRNDSRERRNDRDRNVHCLSVEWSVSVASPMTQVPKSSVMPIGPGVLAAARAGVLVEVLEEMIDGRKRRGTQGGSPEVGSLVIQGPLRTIRDTSEQDLVKMEAAWMSDGLQGVGVLKKPGPRKGPPLWVEVQKLQPELFRIREPRVPNRR